MRRASLDPLVVGRVVGDVLDSFIPTAELVVRYNDKKININGGKVKPSSAAERPKLRITATASASPNKYYTLVMVDPDAPSPSEPAFREWLQWLVINIPEGSDASEGNEVMEYMGPQRPIGIHRHIFAAFQQQQGIMVMAALKGRPAERQLFNTRHFATDNQLGLPVAALYFNSQMQPKLRDNNNNRALI